MDRVSSRDVYWPPCFLSEAGGQDGYGGGPNGIYAAGEGGSALHYDIRRGPPSVGSNEHMREILRQLAPRLLTVACYDREDKGLRELAADVLSAPVKCNGSSPPLADIVLFGLPIFPSVG
ncbi:hypothetical protein SDJN02_23549, partial [Cucurbita argyrosperma subsp. argyrosperma]